jgi:hypothetical protein
MNFRNKLECFVPGKLFQPSLISTLAGWKSVTHGQKKFYNIAPGPNVLKNCP